MTRGVLAAGALAGTLVGLLACGAPDVSSPLVPAPGATFWAVTLQSRAITLSLQPPYDTLQLVATPRSALGTPLVGAPAPTFVTTDSSVRVSPTGLLTARAVRSNVTVIAELTYQGIHLADTAVITVTDPAVTPPHSAAQLVLQPPTPGDTTLPAPTFLSSFYGATGRTTLQAEVRDSSGTVIPEARLGLTTSAAPGVVTFPNGPVQTSGGVNLAFSDQRSRAGGVRVVASATVYGATVADTLTLVLTNPMLEIIRVEGGGVAGAPAGSVSTSYTAAPPGAVPLGVGGTVWWWNATGDSVDVVFDDPTVAVADGTFPSGDGDGNIAPYVGCPGFFECDNLRTRQFPRAGTFPWHSPKTGLTGTIVVQ